MVSVHDEGVLRDRQWKLERRTEVLFGLAIGKSNMEADVMPIELPGPEIDCVRAQIRNRGKRRFVRRKKKKKGGGGGGDMFSI